MSMPDDVRACFQQQSKACAGLGSPFMERLMALCATRLSEQSAVGHLVLNWPGNPALNADNVALRLAGGLHALVLTDTDGALAAQYPPNEASDDDLWAAVERALSDHQEPLLHWLKSAPQTNEVRRAVALVPALHMVAHACPGPVALWEIGCSGGLNLACDQFRVEGPVAFGPQSDVSLTPDWDGPAPTPGDLRIAERRGVDLNPLDPHKAEDRLRLLAYLWPDQMDRKTRTQAAIETAVALPIQVDRADAVDWLSTNLPQRPAEGTTVIYHTIAWQYLPPEAKAKGDALIAAAGAEATRAAPMVRIAMEADGASPGAGLSITTWPGGETVPLARVDFHGRWMRWTGPVSLA